MSKIDYLDYKPSTKNLKITRNPLGFDDMYDGDKYKGIKRSQHGKVNEETFLKSAPLVGQESNVVDGKATLTFKNIMPGTYAITLFHDKNGNKQMDFEVNGMPKEMYGVSNNVMSMGPPQWNDAKFEVAKESLNLEIVM